MVRFKSESIHNHIWGCNGFDRIPRKLNTQVRYRLRAKIKITDTVVSFHPVLTKLFARKGAVAA